MLAVGPLQVLATQIQILDSLDHISTVGLCTGLKVCGPRFKLCIASLVLRIFALRAVTNNSNINLDYTLLAYGFADFKVYLLWAITGFGY